MSIDRLLTLPRQVTGFRAHVQRVLAAVRPGTPVIVLAVDGISAFELSGVACRRATRTTMQTTWPTTSSTCWLSLITGREAHDHGAMGAVQRADSSSTVSAVFHDEELGLIQLPRDTVFTDAARVGYRAVVHCGDFPNPDAAAVRAMTVGADVDRTGALVTREGWTAERVADDLRRWLDAAAQPETLAWVFVDLDAHIHVHGFDEPAQRCLEYVVEIAEQHAARGAALLLVSDHGLTPTVNDPQVEAVLAQCARDGAEVGGAGRVRWLHLEQPDEREDVVRELEVRLAGLSRVHLREDVFPELPLVRERVGEVVVCATGTSFVADSTHRYDHGTNTTKERFVPLCLWMPN